MWKKNIDGEEYFLTKSKYMNGIQCPRLLYKVVNMPDDIPPPDEATQFIFKQGNEVGEMARKVFPGGIRIQMFPWHTITKRTKAALNSLAEHVYEAGFLHDEVVVLVDVLRKLDGKTVDIIEVKQSTRRKDEHIPDLAIQKYVVEGNGFKVNKTFLMHLNRDYVHPGGGDAELLAMEDCTEEVNEHLATVPERLAAMKETCELHSPPRMDIGPHCTSPRECALMPECWARVPKPSIFNITGYRNKWDLYEQGIVQLKDVPDDIKLSNSQQAFLDSYRLGHPIIDTRAIQEELGKMEKPIHFLDFETINWAVPKHEGMRSYMQVPFQWSLHTLEDGKLEHKEFLWDNQDDPRLQLTEKLLDALGDKGSIVVYSSFEKSRLNELADAFPEHRDRINAVVDRLWDQLEIFRNFYTDAAFGGSNSIKNVLPVLVPNLSYKDLEIQQGGLAMATFAKFIEMKPGQEKEKIRDALLKYCERDTFAMVEIHRRLAEL